MLSPRWKKIIADLRGNLFRTLLVVLSIAVGVFTIGSIAGAGTILDREVIANYQKIDPASGVITSEVFDQSLLDELGARDDLALVEGRRVYTVKVGIGDNEFKDLQLFAVEDYNNIPVNRIQAESGAFPPPADAVLIERSAIGIINAEEGDTIEIRTPSGESFELPIAGLTYDASQPSATVLDIGYGYVTFETLEKLGAEAGFNQVLFNVTANADDEEYVNEVARSLRDDLQSRGYVVFNVFVPPPGEPGGYVFVRILLIVLGVIGGLTFLLSGFLIINILSALLSQQTKQIGIMKAIGGKTGQIIRMYAGMLLIFGILAVLIGIPLAWLGGQGLASALAAQSNYEIVDTNPAPWVFGVQLVIGLVVPLVAGIVPVLLGTRVTVRQALDSRGIDNDERGLINRLFSNLRMVPRPILLSFRNMFRKKTRLALTIIILTLAGAIFATIFTVRDSLFATLDDALAYDNYDVSADLNDAYPVDAVREVALNVEGVTAFEPWIETTSAFESEAEGATDVNLVGVPVDTAMVDAIVTEGRWFAAGDTNAIVLNANFADLDGLQVGDEISLNVRGQDSTWEVVGIVRAIFNLENVAYTPYSTLAEVAGEAGLVRTFRVTTSESTGEFQNAVASDLGQALTDNGFITRGTSTTAELEDTFNVRFNSLIFSLFALAGLLGIVGGLGIAGTTSINVIERIREIGVMRSIGAANFQVLGIFIIESVFVGIIGWVIGSIIAVPISRLLSDAVGVAFSNAPLTYQFSAWGAVLWLAVAMILAVISSYLPARRASQITLREVLAYDG